MNVLATSLRKSLLTGALAALLIGVSSAAGAATFTVNSTADAPDADPADGICADSQGRCTLRAAIMQANATGGSNTIDLGLINDPNSPIVLDIAGADETASRAPGGTYAITSDHDASRGDLNITSSVSIVGAGADKTVIEWNPAVKQDPAAGDRVFHIEAVTSNIDVSISGVSIENGVTPAPQVLDTLADGTYYQFERWGGGIAIGAAAAVTLIDPSKTGSESGKGGQGGQGGQGGSGSNEGGGGPGGGEEGESGATINSVTLTDVHILNNESGAAGGGISSAAPLTLDRVLVSGNIAATNGGGIYSDAALTVRDSTVGTMGGFTTPNSAEGGGGLFDTGMHSTSIERSAIVGNKAVGGGGISSRALVTMTIVNSTLAGNEATDVGGGITSNGSVTLQNDTVSGNQSANDSTSGGAGLNAFGPGSFHFVNTLFQSNTASGSGAAASCGCSGSSCRAGAMVSGGHNLSDDSTCGPPAAGDLSNTLASLQALAGNGGATETMALLRNTPAVDAGDDANCPDTDQRGDVRPADGNVAGRMQCDIGSFELFTDTNDLHASANRVQSRVRRGSATDVGIDFTNAANASADATGVMITTAPLPSGYSLSGATVAAGGATSDCAFDPGTRVVTCDVGTLARGGTVSLDLHGAGTQPGRLSFTASITAATPVDPFPDNNTLTVSTLVQGVGNLSVSATGPGQQLYVNGQGSVSFTVRNAGPDGVTNVRLLARFLNRMAFLGLQAPSGVTCALGDDQTYATCTLGTLAPGDSITGTLDLRATSVGNATVDFQVSSDDYDDVSTDDSTTVPLVVLAQTPPPVATSSSGGGGCVSRPGGPFDPALIALVALAAGGLGLGRWRRRAR